MDMPAVGQAFNGSLEAGVRDVVIVEAMFMFFFRPNRQYAIAEHSDRETDPPFYYAASILRDC